MLKRFTAAALAIASTLSFHLPVQADDTQYSQEIQNYLNQLARESDWIREGLGNKHYHFVAYAPTDKLVAIANTTCTQLSLGQSYTLIKAGIVADINLIFPASVTNKLGADGISRFTDVAIKSAVTNTCSQFSNILPQLNYVLPPL